MIDNKTLEMRRDKGANIAAMISLKDLLLIMRGAVSRKYVPSRCIVVINADLRIYLFDIC